MPEIKLNLAAWGPVDPLPVPHTGGAETGDEPYLLSDGKSLMAPIPAVVASGGTHLVGKALYEAVAFGAEPIPGAYSIEAESGGFAFSGSAIDFDEDLFWSPSQLDSSYRANGGWWSAANQTAVGGSVTAWSDKWGVRPLLQPVGAAQPVAGTVGGHACANFLSATAGLFPDAAFTPTFWAVVAQYKTGSETTFSAFARLLCDYSATDNTTPQVFGSSSLNSLNTAGGNAYASTARINGAAPSSVILPRPLAVLSFENAAPAAHRYGLSVSSGLSGRQWGGPICEAIALGAIPDDATRQRIEGYLAHKYGLSLVAGHPYLTSPPRR